MFDIKHTLTLNNREEISLFGEDYFGDKKVFWDFHQTQLQELWVKVKKLGMPVYLTEYPEGTKHGFETLESFTQWLTTHHPFTPDQ